MTVFNCDNVNFVIGSREQCRMVGILEKSPRDPSENSINRSRFIITNTDAWHHGEKSD